MGINCGCVGLSSEEQNILTDFHSIWHFPNSREQWLWESNSFAAMQPKEDMKGSWAPGRYQTPLPAPSSCSKRRSLTSVMSSLNLLGESDKPHLLLTESRLGVRLKCIALAPGPSELLCAVCRVGLGIWLKTIGDFIHLLGGLPEERPAATAPSFFLRFQKQPLPANWRGCDFKLRTWGGSSKPVIAVDNQQCSVWQIIAADLDSFKHVDVAMILVFKN